MEFGDQELEKQKVKKRVKIDRGVGGHVWRRKNKRKNERKNVWMKKKKKLKKERKNNIRNKKSKLINITMIFS